MKRFSLSSYLEHLGSCVLDVSSFSDFEVSDVSNNSRRIRRNSIFVAIKGSERDGHSFINDAVSKGARAVVYTEKIDSFRSGIVYIKVNDAYYAYALLCEKYFDEPSGKLKLMGVTGTNGKTTSVYLLRSVLQNFGFKTGLISTVEYAFGDRVIPADRTTPEAYELQKLFYEMAKENCEYCVMEVSSHALDQRRIGSAKFDGAIFTNLSGDHLDYHKNMENYFLAKERLFTEYLKKDAKAVSNADDFYGRKIKAVTFGLREGVKYKIIPSSDLFKRCLDGIERKGKAFYFNSHLLGLYNAYNVAGVFALLSELGFDKSRISQALSEEISVPGRLERVYGKKNILYFVDYAHSDDALRRVLIALRELKPKSLICVFGCGGNRDKTKRPRMGRVATELADFTIVTSDNPRNEIPFEIIKDVLQGIDDGRDKTVKVIEDRREAVFEAVKTAEERDIVLIAGKGHEDYQEIMGTKYLFSDKTVLQEAINFLEK